MTLNKIVGTMCIYIFLAIAWALCFLLVEYFFPGSVPALKGEDWRDAMQKAVYFSFVTITTLGFGDIILPVEWRILSGMTAANGFLVIGMMSAVVLETLRSDALTPSKSTSDELL